MHYQMQKNSSHKFCTRQNKNSPTKKIPVFYSSYIALMVAAYFLTTKKRLSFKVGPNSPPGIEKSASRRLHFCTCVVIVMWYTCVFCSVHTTTFWALEMAYLFALSRPSEMAEKTARSLLSIISDTVVQREPSCSMAVFAKGVRVSCGSSVV
jgi:hypothetical protein